MIGLSNVTSFGDWAAVVLLSLLGAVGLYCFVFVLIQALRGKL